MSRTYTLGTSQKPKNEISFLALLANNATGPSRKLLIRHGKDGKNIKNAQELEFKLAELWKEQKDKVAFEKELAEIHPHKEFILKNLAPAPEQKNEVFPPQEQNNLQKVGNMIKSQVGEGYSNCGGGGCNCDCNKKSNACGCSSADGNSSEPHKIKVDSAMMFGFGALALVAITALALRKNT